MFCLASHWAIWRLRIWAPHVREDLSVRDAVWRPRTAAHGSQTGNCTNRFVITFFDDGDFNGSARSLRTIDSDDNIALQSFVYSFEWQLVLTMLIALTSVCASSWGSCVVVDGTTTTESGFNLTRKKRLAPNLHFGDEVIGYPGKVGIRWISLRKYIIYS